LPIRFLSHFPTVAVRVHTFRTFVRYWLRYLYAVTLFTPRFFCILQLVSASARFAHTHAGCGTRAPPHVLCAFFWLPLLTTFRYRSVAIFFSLHLLTHRLRCYTPTGYTVRTAPRYLFRLRFAHFFAVVTPHRCARARSFTSHLTHGSCRYAPHTPRSPAGSLYLHTWFTHLRFIRHMRSFTHAVTFLSSRTATTRLSFGYGSALFFHNAFYCSHWFAHGSHARLPGCVTRLRFLAPRLPLVRSRYVLFTVLRAFTTRTLLPFLHASCRTTAVPALFYSLRWSHTTHTFSFHSPLTLFCLFVHSRCSCALFWTTRSLARLLTHLCCLYIVLFFFSFCCTRLSVMRTLCAARALASVFFCLRTSLRLFASRLHSPNFSRLRMRTILARLCLPTAHARTPRGILPLPLARTLHALHTHASAPLHLTHCLFTYRASARTHASRIRALHCTHSLAFSHSGSGRHSLRASRAASSLVTHARYNKMERQRKEEEGTGRQAGRHQKEEEGEGKNIQIVPILKKKERNQEG